MTKCILAAVIAAAVINITVTCAIELTAWFMRDRLPIGTVTSKDIIAECYSPFPGEKMNYWIGVTSPDGNMCTSLIVDEETWRFYEIGDRVTKWGVNE